MGVLLLQLVGPLQSWGTQSRFDVRDTGREPSKSGVIGMIAAAMGRPRSADIADLASLRMGVRVDREGVLLRDFHTVLDVPKASGASPRTVTSERYYLSDAAFLVGLEGSVETLHNCASALVNPVWAPVLGRRACPPTCRILHSEEPLDGGLEDLLSNVVAVGFSENVRRSTAEMARLILEVNPNESIDDTLAIERRSDQPISFAPPQYTLRYIISKRTLLPLPVAIEGGN